MTHANPHLRVMLGQFLFVKRQQGRIARMRRFDDILAIRVEGEDGAAFLDEFDCDDAAALALIKSVLARRYDEWEKAARAYLRAAFDLGAEDIDAFVAEALGQTPSGSDEKPPRDIAEEAEPDEAEKAIFLEDLGPGFRRDEREGAGTGGVSA